MISATCTFIYMYMYMYMYMNVHVAEIIVPQVGFKVNYNDLKVA